MRKTRVTALLLAMAAAGPLHSQELAVTRLDGTTISPAWIDTTVTRLMAATHVTGAGIAIVNDGRIVFLKAYGARSPGRPLTPSSVMTAASLTKSAFATLVMQLVQERVIDLDTPIQRYLPKPLPEYPAYRDLASDPRYRLLTMRMLLSHTSGFPNWRRFMPDTTLRIYFTPGSRFAYSGEGIVLAQLVVETVTRQSANDLMAARIFRPLGMTRTSLVSEPSFEDDHAVGFDEQGAAMPLEHREHANAAGSMQTTLHDYARFVSAVLNGELLSGTTTEIMLRPQIAIRSTHEFPSLAPETTSANRAIRLSYGLGWGLYASPFGEAFFKEGHDNGWRHYVVCFVKPKSGMLIMTNSNNGEDLYSGLLDALLGDTFTPLVWEGFKPPPDTTMTKRE
jgi:CubicO group peptidase (beta-lactamase class C family)